MTIISPPFPSPTTDPDIQEAESIRYGATAFMCVPLTSGRIAVLGHMRDLHAVCDTWQEACEAARSIQMNVWRRSVESKPKRALAHLPELNLDFSGLDLDL